MQRNEFGLPSVVRPTFEGNETMSIQVGDRLPEATFKTMTEDGPKALLQRAGANVPGLLIEPLNRHDAPGYFLRTSGQACAIIDEIADPRLRLMFDCYHTQVTEGDVTRRMTELLPIIGHVQIAGAPSRAEPDEGELDYRHVLAALDALGWTTPVGAEYRPRGTTEAGLGWMKSLTGESAGRD